MPNAQPETDKKAELEIGQFFVKTLAGFTDTIKRFPLAVVFLIILPFQMGNLNPYYASLNLFDKQQQAYCTLAGAVWFAVIELFAECHNWSIQKRYSIGIPVFIGICWFISQSVGLTTSSADMFIVAILLSATFVPWLFKSMENRSFWVFNYRSIFNGCVAFIIFCFLLPGLLNLFYPGFEFQPGLGSAYMPIFYPVGAFWLLSKIPRKLEYTQAEYDSITELPKRLTAVLMPVCCLVLICLNSYLLYMGFKIDGIGKTVLRLITISLVIHLTYCSLYPEENGWHHRIYKNLPWLLILPNCFLLFAIYIRINRFGLTEPRYAAGLFSIGYLLIILWHLLAGTKNFRLDRIPKLLAGLCFLSAFGFWQIGRLPVENQFARLQTLLEKENLFVYDRYVIPALDKQSSQQTRKQIWESLYYLIYKIDINRFRAWFDNTDDFDRHVSCGIHRNCMHYSHVNITLARYMNIMPAQSINTVKSQHVSFDIVYKGVTFDNPLFLMLSESELTLSDVSYGENRFYAVDGFDFVKPFPPGSSYERLKGGVWSVQPNRKTEPKQSIKLEFLGSDNLILKMEEANPGWVKRYPLENAAVSQEELGKQSHFLGEVRALKFDFGEFVEQLFIKYPEQLGKMPSQSDYYKGKLFWLPKDKNGNNPLVLEKTENGLYVKVEMQKLNVYIDSVDGKKKISNFTGMLYLKRLQNKTAKTIVHEVFNRGPMQVDTELKPKGGSSPTIGGFYAVDGYDYFKYFSQKQATSGGPWKIQPLKKKMPKQTIELKHTSPNQLVLTIGDTNRQLVEIYQSDKTTMTLEEYDKQTFYSGKIRQVHLDLTQAIDPITQKITKESNNLPISQSSYINDTPFTVIEKTEEGVHVKFKVLTKSIAVDKKTGKKSLTDFSGIMLVKQL
ncbi:MAG: DUF4153 domain-containing protein [Methylococcaceae bacterium]|nr:DUF4153 domain-containing protein [Methylococcaceae bacterium]